MKEPIEKEREPLQCVPVSRMILRFTLTLFFHIICLWLKWHIENVIFPFSMTKGRQEMLENGLVLKNKRPAIGKPYVKLNNK